MLEILSTLHSPQRFLTDWVSASLPYKPFGRLGKTWERNNLINSLGIQLFSGRAVGERPVALPTQLNRSLWDCDFGKERLGNKQPSLSGSVKRTSSSSSYGVNREPKLRPPSRERTCLVSSRSATRYIRLRAGLTAEKQYLDRLGDIIVDFQNTLARAWQSVEQSVFTPEESVKFSFTF